MAYAESHRLPLMQTITIGAGETQNFQGCILTYGHFSTIHPGHIRYLRHARGLGKKLVVALIGDNSCNTYPFNQNERADALCLLGSQMPYCFSILMNLIKL